MDVGTLIILGLILSPYLALAVAELRERLTDDGSSSYRAPTRGSELGGAGSGPAWPWE